MTYSFEKNICVINKGVVFLMNFFKVCLLFFCFLFFYSISASAEVSEIYKKDGSFVNFCSKGICKNVMPSGDLEKAINDDYSNLSVVDLFRNGSGYVVATNMNSTANQCSEFFSYDERENTFHRIKFSDADICNYKMDGNYLTSVEKDGAKSIKNIYELRNGNYHLKFSDDCSGCSQVIRRAYENERYSKKYLIDQDDDFLRSKSLSSIVIVDRAFFYSDHDVSNKTKMYLIKGDLVKLSDFYSGDEIWYRVDYTEKNGSMISKWIKCNDLKICVN